MGKHTAGIDVTTDSNLVIRLLKDYFNTPQNHRKMDQDELIYLVSAIIKGMEAKARSLVEIYSKTLLELRMKNQSADMQIQVEENTSTDMARDIRMELSRYDSRENEELVNAIDRIVNRYKPLNGYQPRSVSSTFVYQSMK